MSRIYYIILLSFIYFGIVSCSLDIPTENELTDPQALTSVQSAYEALSTAYATFPKEHFRLSIMADDYAPLSNARMSVNTLNAYQWLPVQMEKDADILWQSYYQCIVYINAVLTRINLLREDNVEEVLQIERIQAEAECLKALCYLDLLQLFATVYNSDSDEGIILKSNVEAEELDRSSKKECVREIQRLLESSLSLFDKTKAIIPIHSNDHSFVSKDATVIALSRLYLYTGNYEKAKEYSQMVLNDYPINNLVFDKYLWEKPTNNQSILSLANNSSFYTDSFLSEREKSDFMYMINPEVSYDEHDIRAAIFVIDSILPATIGGKNKISLLGKYNITNLSRQDIKQVSIIRPIEALFISAEASVHLNEFKEARDLMNSYLSRINAAVIDESISGTLLLNRIMQEKHKEFIGENIRFFDMKRLGISRKIFSINGLAQSLEFKSDDYRWTLPIPQSEYRTNSALKTQNKSWPQFKRIRNE